MTAADPSLRRLSYPLRAGPFSEPFDISLLPLSAISTSGAGSNVTFLLNSYLLTLMLNNDRLPVSKWPPWDASVRAFHAGPELRLALLSVSWPLSLSCVLTMIVLYIRK